MPKKLPDTSKFPTFQTPMLLLTALTHRSAINEKITPAKEHNERLEFLGDAVLELVATEFLYRQLPNEPEGRLTAVRSALVRTTTLAEVGKEIGIGQELYLSKGEESTGGRENESLLANSIEALIGALYLDQGIEAVKTFLEQHLFPKFDQIMADKLYRDHKSRLQEVVQAQGHPAPVYTVTGEAGPDHEKIFTVQVAVSGQACGEGSGKSKQLAQQEAATVALRFFKKHRLSVK
jgi:ribonuclease-3